MNWSRLGSKSKPDAKGVGRSRFMLHLLSRTLPIALKRQEPGDKSRDRKLRYTSVKKIQRSNLSEEAYVYVRDLFLEGTRYNPGDKVSVEELSRDLGISRTPLWGAINRLEAEGIVETVARQGVYLIDYDPARAIEIYETREVLEGLVARLAAERITPSQLQALRRLNLEQRARLEAGDLAGYYAAALKFHDKLAEIAGNRTTQALLQSIQAQMQAMRLQKRYVPLRLPKKVDDHARILAALEKRDPDLAEKEVRLHIRALAEQLKKGAQSDERAEPLGGKRKGRAKAA